MAQIVNPWNQQALAQTLQNTAQAQNTKLAGEQWDWQKKLYQQQLAAGKQAGGALGSLVGQYNTAYGEAKTANEQRYNEMLGITDQTSGQRMSDVRADYLRQGSDQMQNLARLGMSNTTIAPTMQYGNQRQMQSALNRTADELQGTKLGIMERRTDEYPESNVLMALVQALGQGGAGLGALSSLGNLRLS